MKLLITLFLLILPSLAFADRLETALDRCEPYRDGIEDILREYELSPRVTWRRGQTRELSGSGSSCPPLRVTMDSRSMVNGAGKNPNTYFEVTPAGGVEKAAAEYAAKQAKKAPKTHRRETEEPTTACTETRKARLIIEYISSRKSRTIAYSSLTRMFGRDAMETLQSLCEEGVLCEVVKRDADGKNPNLYYEVTPRATSITTEQFIKED